MIAIRPAGPGIAVGLHALGIANGSKATGILLLPEHSPLLVAKQAATLDLLSRGRFVSASALAGRLRSSLRSVCP